MLFFIRAVEKTVIIELNFLVKYSNKCSNFKKSTRKNNEKMEFRCDARDKVTKQRHDIKMIKRDGFEKVIRGPMETLECFWSKMSFVVVVFW